MDPVEFETVEQFMARALHDPVRGYYARNIRGIGSRGDFTTAPQLSDAPARAIAAWIARSLKETGVRHVIEVGPGQGTLTAGVMDKLPFLTRLGTRFHLVESSPTLAERQKELLGKRVSHHTTIHQALTACSGQALVFSNELVDAFPARVFRKTRDGWSEVALGHRSGYTDEILLPPGEVPPSSIFSVEFPIGQTVEIHDSYRHWLRSWLPCLKRGGMLTIDYGDCARNIYPGKPRGTLRAYLLQQRLEGSAVFANAGMQDITADVNFTDLAEWASPWLLSLPPIPFSDFIRPHADASDASLLEAAAHFRALLQHPLTGAGWGRESHAVS